MANLTKRPPIVLIIRDGWGENPHPEHDAFNAVKLAKKPVDDRLRRDWPWTLVKTSGPDVGVPADQTGNSEVGHQNIGAGRIVDQEVLRVNKACESGAIADNPVVQEGLRKAKAAGKLVHLMGICSEAGVHGRLSHLYALLKACKKHGIAPDKVAVHLFMDGRDTPPTAGRGYVGEVEAQIKAIGVGSIATVAGRYWAMDRDFRWERVKLAYDALTGRGGVGVAGAPAPVAASAEAAVGAYYEKPISPTQGGDEFVTPTMIAPSASRESAMKLRIGEGDTVFFYNYRGDRPRELAMAFIMDDKAWAGVKASPDSGARGFDRGPKLNTYFAAMTAWSEDLTPLLHVVFGKPAPMHGIAGEVWSKAGLRQFRCAETEKYPHVTFFFNDYREQPFPGETRANPQSPQVKTYDLKPEMAAREVRDAVLARLAASDCEDVLVVNFANCDMVGHTGNLKAAIQAVEVTDQCVGAIVDAVLARGGSLVVCADHGNAEQMWDSDANCPHTAHTFFDVPLLVIGEAFKGKSLRGDRDPSGWFKPEVREARPRLADVAPTLLAMVGMPQPAEMTGRTILQA